MSAVTLDFSKAQPLPAQGGVTLDFSKAVPLEGSKPADTRNAVQRYVDNLTTVTPEQEAGHSALVNRAQEFGAGAIQGLTQPIVHPLDTLSAVGNAIAHPRDTAKAAFAAAKQNPAQFAGQLVGGAVLGEAAAPVAGAVTKGANAAVKAAGVPEHLYESALKPATTIPVGERASIVQTGLDQAIPVSKSGIDKLGDLVSDLNDKIKAQIAADPNRPVSTVPALRNLDSVRGKFTNQVTPQPDMADINQVQQNFLNNPKVAPSGAGPGPSSIPAADAQAMKQGTYQALGSKAYGEVKGASIEAQKALARGLKEEIANQFPEINNLNAQESKLFDLGPVLEKAVNRAGNHQLIGLGTPAAATAGGLVMGSAKAGAALGALKLVLDNPMVKSRLAIALSKGGNIPFAQALAKVSAYDASLSNAASAGIPSGQTSPQP